MEKNILQIDNRKDFREWLKLHADSENECWIEFEIKATGAEFIEMETGTFYTLAKLFDVPSIALLAVSDNSATDVPLLGRGEELAQKYINTRSDIIPDMIFRIARD